MACFMRTKRHHSLLKCRLPPHFRLYRQEAIGQPLDIIIPNTLRAAGLYAQTTRSGQTRCGPGDLLAVLALCQDGRRISVEFSIIPFRDSAGAMAGIGAIMRDVTNRFEEIKALRRALRASKPQKTD
jgi:PAS domain S-box-containing protein